jgi:hypothetical protein
LCVAGKFLPQQILRHLDAIGNYAIRAHRENARQTLIFSFGNSLVEQSEIRDNSITHKPTGWRFTAYEDSPTDGTVIRGRLGDELETGEDFRPHEVEEMARRLWARHLEARNKQL